MPRPTWTALPALCALACGGGTPPPPTDIPFPVAPASAAPSASVAAAPVRRTPPDTLLRYWPFGAHPRLALYGDASGLFHTELGGAILPGAVGVVKGMATNEQTMCLRGAADSVKDLLVGADDHGAILIARFDDTAFDPGPCLERFLAQPARIDGARQAYDIHGTLVVHDPGVLVLGLDRLVRAAMEPRTDLSGFPHALTLGPDEYITWTAQFDEDAKASGTLLASPALFHLGVEADVPMLIAQQVESQVGSMRGKGQVPGLEGEQAAMASKLLQSLQVKRTGSHLSAAFDLHEPPADQTRDLGLIATLAIDGVRKYTTGAKSAEARNSLNQIAKDYGEWWEREGGKHGRHKLVSFPPVPATVPRGTKYQSSAADWQAWAPLHFTLDAPQYYQYEVQASRNGRSADIIARGDLDADGKDSEFRLHLSLDHDKLVVAPSIDERDPDD